VRLEHLHLINFKNYAELKIGFSPKINVLVGKNGTGKTNLLDAIHYLSMTRSAFSSSDNFSIRNGESFFMVKGKFKMEKDVVDITCSVQIGSKKIVREGVNEYNKLSDHIGKYPVVLITPDDTELVKEGSEERRKFFDSIISQLDHQYLNALMQYTHALKQRNSLLKMFADTNSFDDIALQSYDQVLIQKGKLIYDRRKEFISEFLPLFQHFYDLIVEEEQSEMLYVSELNQYSFEDGMNANRKKDVFLQRTSFGIHRDDYQFTLGGGDLKRLGSQGQQKSFVIALKLAQFQIIRNHKNFKPLLLLDDIFDKLDDVRIARLLDMIKNDQFGQLFITDARPDRTSSLLKEVNAPATIFTVLNGQIQDEQKR
jgi:DNA replication and repair protein RecF